MKKIIGQKVIFEDLFLEGDMNNCQLVTKFDDGSILSEPLTLDQALSKHAELRDF